MNTPQAPNTEDRMRQHALLDSSDLNEVRAGVAGVLSEHRLAPHSASLHARLYATGTEHLKVCMLEYGGGVTVHTQPAADFLLVQSAVRGSVTVGSAAGTWTIRPGRGVILPPGMPLQLDWDTAALQILVKIPMARLKGVYESLVGRPLDCDLSFHPELCFDTVAGSGWHALVNHYCDQVENAGSSIALMRARVAEQALMGHLLCSYSCGMAEEVEAGRNIAPRHVRRAREFIEARLGDPITLADIAQAASVSARSLSRAYQQHYGISPMAAVRLLRLERIHSELKTAQRDASVSDIAFRWGCFHLGRFAAVYRQRYGQAPHDTLRQRHYGAH